MKGRTGLDILFTLQVLVPTLAWLLNFKFTTSPYFILLSMFGLV